MAKRGAIWGAFGLTILGCGGRSAFEPASKPTVGGTGGYAQTQGGNGGNGDAESGGLGGAAGNATGGTLPGRQRHFLLETNGLLSKQRVVTLNERGNLSTWDITPPSLESGDRYEVSLSPNGRWATMVFDSDENSEFSLIDLDTRQTTDLLELGVVSEVRLLSSPRWVDEQRLLSSTTSDDDASGQLDRRIVRVEPESGSAYVGPAEPPGPPVVLSAVAPNGQWIASVRDDWQSACRLEVAPIGDDQIGAAVLSEPCTDGMSGWFEWAPDSRTVTLRSFFGTTADSYVTYNVSTTPSLVNSAGLGNRGPVVYSPASNYLLWPWGDISDGKLPVQTLATGTVRWLSLPEDMVFFVNGNTGNAISPLDDYFIVTGGGKLSYVPLRNADGSDIDNPAAILLENHGVNSYVSNVTSIRGGGEIVYIVGSPETSTMELYWLSVNNPSASIQRISDLLDTNVGEDLYVAPTGDYVAVPSVNAERLYLVKLSPAPTVQVVEVAPAETGNSIPLQIAWAPDDSGVIVVRVGAAPAVYFLPRLAERTQGFGTLRSISVPRLSENEDAFWFTLPRNWD